MEEGASVFVVREFRLVAALAKIHHVAELRYRPHIAGRCVYGVPRHVVVPAQPRIMLVQVAQDAPGALRTCYALNHRHQVVVGVEVMPPVAMRIDPIAVQGFRLIPEYAIVGLGGPCALNLKETCARDCGQAAESCSTRQHFLTSVILRI